MAPPIDERDIFGMDRKSGFRIRISSNRIESGTPETVIRFNISNGRLRESVCCHFNAATPTDFSFLADLPCLYCV